MSKYDEILDYKYVMKHDRMPLNKRAFQFAPFSALTGYSETIKEKGRETINKKIISDETKELLDYKLKIINDHKNNHPRITITYFINDSMKEGGRYQKITDYLKKIDFNEKIVILENKTKIKIDNIINIDSLDIDLNDFLS